MQSGSDRVRRAHELLLQLAEHFVFVSYRVPLLRGVLGQGVEFREALLDFHVEIQGAPCVSEFCSFLCHEVVVFVGVGYFEHRITCLVKGMVVRWPRTVFEH